LEPLAREEHREVVFLGRRTLSACNVGFRHFCDIAIGRANV
jgi:hypothetical protein